jgi:hypothetical protein
MDLVVEEGNNSNMTQVGTDPEQEYASQKYHPALFLNFNKNGKFQINLFENRGILIILSSGINNLVAASSI